MVEVKDKMVVFSSEDSLVNVGRKKITPGGFKEKSAFQQALFIPV
ncbi:hypothetical protein ACLQ7P_22545 [Bacillus subtilis subsp. subtilis]